MKFCEKLQKLRKEKGYSQEQLADLLDVSRQSVSKWESGTTYPEMDKLLSLCKIFDVTLDDLTNDEVSEATIKERNKSNFGNLVYAILDIINKSIEMFKSMDKKEIIKCISELFILFIILLIFKLPFNYLNESVARVFINFSSRGFQITNSIWLLLSNTIYLILFIAIFIYVYKIRFLDKFEYQEKEVKENNNESKDLEEKEPEIKEAKKKTTKHSYILFDALGSIFNIILKICLFFICLPLVICFIILIVFTFIALIFQFMNLNYIGVFICLLGTTIALFIIMEIFIRFLFSSAIKFSRMFITFSIGLILIGFGGALFAFEISSTNYIDDIPKGYNIKTDEYTYEMTDNLKVFPYYRNIEYQVDDTLEDEVKVIVNYYDDFIYVNVSKNSNDIFIHTFSEWKDGLNLLALVKDNLANKTIYNYSLLSEISITVLANSSNLEKLQENWQNYIEEEQNRSDELNYYNQMIDSLESEIDNKNNEIYNLQERITELEEKLSNIQDLME